MLSKIFTVYDAAAGAFLPPFFVPTKAMAIRAFKESCNDPNHNFFKYRDQYTLFELGDYDDQGASFTLHPSPISFGLAQDYFNGKV
jgi:hypothetical protein